MVWEVLIVKEKRREETERATGSLSRFYIKTPPAYFSGVFFFQCTLSFLFSSFQSHTTFTETTIMGKVNKISTVANSVQKELASSPSGSLTPFI